jgi:uncharacterized protein
MTWALVALVGGCVGFLAGLFGKGGSAIATPLLYLVGIPPIVAVAAPLPATIPSTSLAAWVYWRERLIDWQLVRWSVAVGVPATVAGAILTRWIGGTILVDATDVIIAGLGVRLLVTRASDASSRSGVGPTRLRLVLVAVAVGLVSGLLANSGGFLLAPLYITVLHVPIKRAFACSLAVAATLAIPGTVVHWALGHIDWTVVAVFGATSIPLSYVGARLAVRANSARLERIYGAGLAVLGLGLLALHP